MNKLPKILLIYSTIIALILFVIGVVTSKSDSALLFQLLLLPVVLYLVKNILKIKQLEIDFKPSVAVVAVFGFICLTSFAVFNISRYEPETAVFKNEKSITTISIKEPINGDSSPQYIFVELESDTDYINIKSEDNINSESIGQAIDGERFELIEELSDWYKIKTIKNEGYINKDYAVKN